MTATKLRAIARILSDVHADIGDALEPFFDEKNANAIVQAGRRFFDELDELESVVTAELGKLAQAERGKRAELCEACAAASCAHPNYCPRCGQGRAVTS